MSKKYELIKSDSVTTPSGKKLYRIKALKDFSDVKAGDLGGYIMSEDNLNHDGDAWVHGDACVFGNARVHGDAHVYGNAWVYGDAWVYGNARVYDNAQVYDNTRVYGDAWVHGDAQVCGNARVHGDACVYDNARVYGDAWVHGDAQVCGNAHVYGDVQVCGNAHVYGDACVYGNARVYDNAQVCCDAQVYGDARVYDNAQVFGNAWVYGDAHVHGDAIIKDEQRVVTGYITNSNSTIREQLMNQCLVIPDENGFVTLYKRVNKIDDTTFKSCYDASFVYKIGEYATVDGADTSNTSCSSGIHVSHPNYWNEGDTLIACQVHIDDIITVQAGKVRCKRVKVLSEVK